MDVDGTLFNKSVVCTQLSILSNPKYSCGLVSLRLGATQFMLLLASVGGIL
jgi:hypothetical protein